QIGYMVTAIGIGSELAINGATAHAFNHIIYKSLLFMAAGAVIHATGKSRLSELGGFAKKMPLIVGLYMVGAFSIAGAPLLNGFISKTMITGAANAAHLEMVILLLLIATIGTFLHTGLKLPYFTWFGEDKEEIQVSDIPKNMLAAMVMGAFLCVSLGLFPNLLYSNLPYAIDFTPFSVYNFVEMTQILLLTFVGFWLFRNKFNISPSTTIDTDWFYRKPANLVFTVFVKFPALIFDIAEKKVASAVDRVADVSKNPLNYMLPTSPKSPVYTDGFTSPLHLALGLILLSFLIVSLIVLL
ncbi:MAG: proton-conducting transporter membrane subunit, partial [Balneolaceae bacterium]